MRLMRTQKNSFYDVRNSVPARLNNQINHLNKGCMHRLFTILLSSAFVLHLGCAQNVKKPENINTMERTEKNNFNTLSAEEERIIVRKGTEQAFTGKYFDSHEKGTYICKRCNAPLYRSEDKFDSHCGWPSFDDEIKGAVIKVRDADGMRTEIMCANCKGHLGHVFEGEGMTDKNVRHCVNSASMSFIPAGKAVQEKKTADTALFASGCFWGTEYYLQKAKGVISTETGYTGGKTSKPSYHEVSSGNTGHAETVRVIFDPSITSYEALAKLFFETHDPTQIGGQGPDIGSQYRTAIFYTNEDQKKTAEQLIATLKAKGIKAVTEVTKAREFWPGEKYHQDYYEHSGGTPYCHKYHKIF